MPKVVIPDKICPHCGGNEWFISYPKRKDGTVRTKYSCLVRMYEAKERYNKKHSDELKILRRKGGKYYKKTRERDNKYIKNLSDSYVKARAAASLGKKYKDVTLEEIQNKREEIIKIREYKKIPYKERRKQQYRQHHIKRRETLNDSYVKSVIRNTLRQKTDILPSSDEISNNDVIKTRASIKACRKQKSTSYIKTLIQNSIRNQTGETVSFDNISKNAVRKYRRCLRRIRYYRELNKLLT